MLSARRIRDGNLPPNSDGDLEGGVTMHVAGRRRASVHRVALTDGEAGHQTRGCHLSTSAWCVTVDTMIASVGNISCY